MTATTSFARPTGTETRNIVAMLTAVWLGASTVGANADTKVVKVGECSGDRKVTLELDEDTLQWKVEPGSQYETCICHDSAEELKKLALAYVKNPGPLPASHLRPVSVAPGETKSGTFYCYWRQDLIAINRKQNRGAN